MWLVLALGTAFFESLKDVFSKYGLKAKGLDEYLLSWALIVFSLPFLLPLLLLEDMPTLQPRFWWALALDAPLHVLAWTLYMRALRMADLSECVPLVTTTPLFMLATSPFMIGEYPSVLGIVGVMLIVLGSWMLNARRGRGLLQPFALLVRSPGSRAMLAVAFIWSITSNFDKIGIAGSSTYFWGCSLYAAMGVLMTLLLLLRGQRGGGRLLLGAIRPLLLVGAANALMMLTYLGAIQTGFVVYTIAIKRLSVLMSVLFGYFFFGETRLRERLAAAALMTLGVAVVALGQ